MIIPTLRYDDAKGAIEFLERAFGFDRKAVMESDDGTSATPSSPTGAAWS